jgi:predicted NAD/FAD-dependent oxidoreductase
MPNGRRCVVVGAGVAGLAAARALVDGGASVVVLDKGRAPGGRLATRRVEGAVFDHGAQFFTARDGRLETLVAAWREAGAVRQWFEGAWRGARGMSSLARHLAEGLDVRTGVTVRAVARSGGGYVVDGGEGHGCEVVVLTAPVPQSLALLDAGGVALEPAVRDVLAGVAYDRCLAGMFDAPWSDALPAHGVARVDGGVLSWLASNRAKGLCEADAVTAHASAAWSLAHWDDDDAAVLAAMGAEVTRHTGAEARPVALKRWRYARPTGFIDGPVVVRAGGAAVVFAGDAFDADGGRVEAAWRSGVAAAAAA